MYLCGNVTRLYSLSFFLLDATRMNYFLISLFQWASCMYGKVNSRVLKGIVWAKNEATSFLKVGTWRAALRCLLQATQPPPQPNHTHTSTPNSITNLHSLRFHPKDSYYTNNTFTPPNNNEQGNIASSGIYNEPTNTNIVAKLPHYHWPIETLVY